LVQQTPTRPQILTGKEGGRPRRNWLEGKFGEKVKTRKKNESGQKDKERDQINLGWKPKYFQEAQGAKLGGNRHKDGLAETIRGDLYQEESTIE